MQLLLARRSPRWTIHCLTEEPPRRSDGTDGGLDGTGTEVGVDVVSVAGEDYVARLDDQGQMPVHYVVRPALLQQGSDRSTSRVVETNGVASGQHPSQVGLSSTAPPHLGDNGCARSNRQLLVMRQSEDGPDRAVLAVHGDQRPGIEDQRHQVVARLARRRTPSVRAASSSSASLKGVLSASPASRADPSS